MRRAAPPGSCGSRVAGEPFIPALLSPFRPRSSIPLPNSPGGVPVYPGTITVATAATPSPLLTSDCSSTSASPEPAVPVLQSAYRVEPESGGDDDGGLAGLDPPSDHEDTDMYEDFDEEPKSDYSSDRELVGAN